MQISNVLSWLEVEKGAKEARAALLSWLGAAYTLGSGQRVVLQCPHLLTGEMLNTTTAILAQAWFCGDLAWGSPHFCSPKLSLCQAKEALSKLPAGDVQLVPVSRWCQDTAGKGWLAWAELCCAGNT